ncbi:two component transcriptional regulator, LytTR family [Belliella buryatensis]|uniref:Two component transcriptional regulator, LytTR family n=1 Tax=Belliella buryatensis TaxID=1500549 RepID=A0A239CP52_9BACT|nr:LytTR family DNA-binding domain-containing protein [Belliella buryatensis]SNS21719.1 two component transcriptional regulator, LytTR family [Belliella buryatensis]
MKIAIVEDEPLTLNRIRNIINAQNSDLEVVATAQSNKELLELLRSDVQIDLMLCDIHLADGLSFNVLKDNVISFPIVFVTAYDKYALESFDHNCVDYILKPIQEERLLKAFDKVKNLKSQSLDLTQINADLLKNMILGYQSKDFKKRFLTKSGSKIRFVNAQDIAYFYSYEGITYVYEKETKKKSIIDFTLSELEAQHLDPSKFFRVSRSVIIQLDDLVEMKPYQNGRMMLMMNTQPETDIIVARDRVNDFKNWINQ